MIPNSRTGGRQCRPFLSSPTGFSIQGSSLNAAGIIRPWEIDRLPARATPTKGPPASSDRGIENEIRQIVSSVRLGSAVARGRRVQPAKRRKPRRCVSQGVRCGHRERDADESEAGRVDRRARRQRRPCRYARSARHDPRSTDVAGRARRGGGQEGIGQKPGRRRTDRCDRAIRSRECVRRRFHQEQSGERRRREGRLRSDRQQHHGSRVQSSPHPGRRGVGSEGHHREAEQGFGCLREARCRTFEGSGSKDKGGDLDGWT